MELKPVFDCEQRRCVGGLDRTNVELKPTPSLPRMIPELCLDRTNVELKLETRAFYCASFVKALIEPMWN